MIRDTLYQYIKDLFPDEMGYTIEFQEDDTKGHYATNCAFLGARRMKKNPLDIAGEAVKILKEKKLPLISDVRAVAPGFINIWIRPEYFIQEIICAIKDEKFGSNKRGEGKKIRIEYVSANPTGPIHIGNARGGPYGESLARALEMNSYHVLREYFHNDIGGQVEKLGHTVWYWYEKLRGNEIEFPEEGYQGTYIEEVAKHAIEAFGKDLTENDISKLTEFALSYIFQENKKVLDTLGIRFDLIRSEGDLVKSGKTQEALEILRQRGFLKEADGALWFAPNDEFLQDRESVVIRSNGAPTYFASDIAYHREKFESGYDVVIDIFGSNHHGHVPKLQAIAKVFGFDTNKFLVLLYQFVRVKKGNEIVKMSKRAGTYVTAKEVLDEVGPDNMIFSLLSSAPSTHIDFDLDVVKEQSMKNPVYYIQYAYVRAQNILEKSGVSTIDRLESMLDASLFSSYDITLARYIAQYPEIIADVAEHYEIHRITRYAFELARAFHNFYEHERVIGEEDSIFNMRVALVIAARNTLRSVAHVIGISTPSKM